MHRRTFLKTACAATLLGHAVRSAAADRPSAGDLAGDVAVLRQALTLHPGLYRYTSPARFEQSLARFSGEFTRAPDLAARYLALARLTATIRCGHSYGNFFNQNKAVAAELFDRPTRLPLHFAWVGRSMVVLRDPAGELRRGTVIERLNGSDPARLRDTLLPMIRTDGHNAGKQISLLEVRGDDEIETFDVFQGLVAPPRDQLHRLAVREPGGRRRNLELPAIGLTDRKAMMSGSESSADQPLWRWAVRPDGVAVLTMPGWALWNSKWDWRRWLDERLGSLGGAKGLVIDLRDNEGGDEACGAAILARLIDRPLTISEWQQRIRFRRTPAALDPYLDTWDQSFRTLGETARDLGNGFLLRPQDSDDQRLIQPAASRLRVPVAALIGPVNSSATFQFAGNLRAIGAAKLYGRETGGNRRGINGGAFFFVRLPASGLEFDLPLIGYYPTTPQPDAGIVPDVVAAPAIADIAAGRDPVLERAATDLSAG